MPNLTPLELAALRLLNRGLTYAQIAAGLGISPALTHKHIAGVYAKIHVNNHLDAIRAAVALDLIAAIEQIPAKTITNSDTIITNCDSVRQDARAVIFFQSSRQSIDGPLSFSGGPL
jgi:DNA-binding CsgD family transcriptional regulator